MKSKHHLIKQHWLYWLIGLILTLAIAVRLVGLGSVPASLYWDEIAMLVDSRSIAATGNDFHGLPGLSPILPSYGDYKLPVYVWLSVPSMKLSLPPEIQIRLVSALIGIATVVISGLLAYELLPRSAKQFRTIFFLTTLFVLAILPWSIVFSHAAFEGHLGQFLLTLSIYFILKSRNRHWLLLLSGLIGIVAMDTYYSVRFVWPLVALAGCIFVYFTQAHQTKHWTKSWIFFTTMMFIVFALGWLGMTQARWYHESEQFRLGSDSILTISPYVDYQNTFREIGGNSLFTRIFSHRRLLQLHDFVANFSEYLNPTYLFFHGDANVRHGTGWHGLAYLAMLPLLVLGIMTGWKRYRMVLFFLISWWFIALIPASIPNDVPHALRSLNAMVPFGLLIALGLAEVFYNSICLRFKVGLLFVGVLLASFAYFAYYYFLIYPVVSASSWQSGYDQLAKQVATFQRESADSSPVYIDNGDSRFFLWYLIYSGINPENYAKSEQHAFEITSINDQVHFMLPSSFLPAIEEASRKQQTEVIFAGKTDSIEDRIRADQLTPTKRSDVLDQQGNLLFSVIVIRP